MEICNQSLLSYSIEGCCISVVAAPAISVCLLLATIVAAIAVLNKSAFHVSCSTTYGVT